jgi:hypothetical protein
VNCSVICRLARFSAYRQPPQAVKIEVSFRPHIPRHCAADDVSEGPGTLARAD